VRIISNYKDYYDSLQDFDTPVWNRTYQSIIERDRKFKNLYDKLGFYYFNHTVKNSYNSFTHYCPVILGFCGTYTKYSFEIETDSEDHVCVSEDFLLPLNKDSFNLIEITKDKDLKKTFGGSYFNTDISFLNQENLFVKYNSPIIFIHGFQIKVHDFEINGDSRNKFKVVVNPSLKKLGYQNKKDIQQVYQELDMFVSGVLTNKETRPELNEKHRGGSRFDKYSFKKLPEIKK
jgi:hypothetical protein